MSHDEIRYRVIYRRENDTLFLGRVVETSGNRWALDPFHSRLRLAGVQDGEILLVEEATQRIVARRTLRPPRRNA